MTSTKEAPVKEPKIKEPVTKPSKPKRKPGPFSPEQPDVQPFVKPKA